MKSKCAQPKIAPSFQQAIYADTLLMLARYWEKNAGYMYPFLRDLWSKSFSSFQESFGLERRSLKNNAGTKLG